MIDTILLFVLLLSSWVCGYLLGIRRGRAVEAKRWRRRHQPRLSDLLLAARERDMRAAPAGAQLPQLPTFRPDWSPCSQPLNSGTTLNPPLDSP